MSHSPSESAIILPTPVEIADNRTIRLGLGSQAPHETGIMRRDQRPSTTRSARRSKNQSINAMDRHVGLRIRARRLLKGMSQQALADALDLTLQQVRECEKGVNRIGAGRLGQIAAALETSIGYFYQDAPSARRPVDNQDTRC